MHPLHSIPPIPFGPHFVSFKREIKSILLVLSVNANLVAIIAGSRAWILILLGLEAKFAPDLINPSKLDWHAPAIILSLSDDFS